MLLPVEVAPRTQGRSGDEVTGPPGTAVPDFISDAVQLSPGRFCLLLLPREKPKCVHCVFFPFLCKLPMFLAVCPVALVTALSG